MCGRFVSTSSPDEIANFFDAHVDVESLGQNYNVAPTQDVYGVVADTAGERTLEAFRWGLLPVWAKDVKAGARMINARSETLAEKPAFKSVFRKHRCIIPMNGFYEWTDAPEGSTVLTKSGKPAKQPMFISPVDQDLFAVAGLWNAWRPNDADDNEPWLHTASVITTSANQVMEPIHNRMPVMLHRDAWEEWLDPANQDLTQLGELLVPAPNEWLSVRPVTMDVNNARNNGPELLQPFETDPGNDDGAE